MKKIISSIIIGTLCLVGMGQKLTLDSCKYYALENNKRLKEALLKRDAAEQVKKNAFTNYFPTLNASAVAMKADKGLIEGEIPEMNLPVYDGNPANLANPTQFTYFPGMSLELLDYANVGMITAIEPLYAGGRIRNGNKLAALGIEFSEHQLNLSKEEILVKTEEFYWTVVALEEKKKTLNSYEELLTSLYKDVSVSFNAGLIQKSDLLKVQMELNQIEANKIKLDNGLALLKMTLCQHVGISYSDSICFVNHNVDAVSPETLFVVPSIALKNRNEYQMLNKAIDAELLQGKMARGEYMPSLAVGVQGLSLDIMETQNNYGLAFATLSIPISDWWGGSHKIQEHKIKVDIAKNNRDEKSELLLLQINKAYNDLIESYKQILVAKSSVEQAVEHLKVVKDNFEAGVAGTSDLLEAQAMHQQAKDALVDVNTSYKIKQAYYKQSTAQRMD